mmetsp:Transcript_10695/g.20508  ORF Transcript_10695/g.20508 Transcript_10695/m.20508 type:complete len:213 (-) Transcript_10695:414-1052(-)
MELFRAQVPSHDQAQSLLGFHFAAEDEIDGTEQGQLKLVNLCEAHNFLRRRDSLNHLANLVERLLYRFALSQCHTTTVVTGERGEAREHEVAYATQSSQGLWLASQSDGQLPHLAAASRHQPRNCALPESKASRHTRANGQWVFECAPDFHADDVVGRVAAKSYRRQQLLHLLRHLELLGGHHDCHRVPFDHLLGEAWTREVHERYFFFSLS